jgi:N-acetylmuramoyl-L-alanine amidase
MRWSSWVQSAIVVAALGSALVAVGPVREPQSSPPLGPQGASSPSPSPTPEAQRHVPGEFFVMIDPGHGGDDNGALLGAGHVPEKDISLALARELKRQLEERNIPARLLRESDVTLSLERRATITNEQHAGLYIALHAGQPGKGVRVYTPSLSPPPSRAVGTFQPWDDAQAGSLEKSRNVAHMVGNELVKTGLPVVRLAMSLRPLNNVVAPAIAVEWAPGPEDLHAPRLQKIGNTLAAAIAAGIAEGRSQGAEHL